MLAFVQPVPSDFADEFEELLASKRESAPGPDGLPYSVCRSAGGTGGQISIRRLPGYFVGIGSPCWLFGACRKVFIPKSGELDAQGLLVRSLESLRPRYKMQLRLQGYYRCHVFEFTKILHQVHSHLAEMRHPACHDRQHF